MVLFLQHLLQVFPEKLQGSQVLLYLFFKDLNIPDGDFLPGRPAEKELDQGFILQVIVCFGILQPAFQRLPARGGNPVSTCPAASMPLRAG